VAQLQATRPRRAARPRRPRGLLDPDLHQLAAHRALHPRLVAGLPKRPVVLIGVHTPEFSSEHQIGRDRQATTERGINDPVAVDNDYEVWSTFDNHDWPALYLVDAHGIIGDHHVGEGRYEQAERAVQRLLGVERELVCVEGLGVLIGVLGFPP
jgi:hypothetical protein